MSEWDIEAATYVQWNKLAHAFLMPVQEYSYHLEQHLHMYYVSKKSPILYSKLLYKMGHYFLDIQVTVYVQFAWNINIIIIIILKILLLFFLAICE